jgi:hypothetical protein
LKESRSDFTQKFQTHIPKDFKGGGGWKISKVDFKGRFQTNPFRIS